MTRWSQRWIYYCHRPLAPTILGQSITFNTRNSKVLNKLLYSDLDSTQSELFSFFFNFFFSLMSLVGDQFGQIDFLSQIFIFERRLSVENNNKDSKFDTSKSMSYQGHKISVRRLIHMLASQANMWIFFQWRTCQSIFHQIWRRRIFLKQTLTFFWEIAALLKIFRGEKTKIFGWSSILINGIF